MTPLGEIRRVIACAAAVALASLPAAAARAQVDVPDDFVDLPVAGGIDEPLNLAFLADGRLLMVERDAGNVRMLVNGAFSATDPILHIPDVRIDYDEQGLLGIAVDPGWPARPYVYVHYTSTLGVIRISRFTASGDLSFAGSGDFTLDLGSQYDLQRFPDAALFHNGGSVRFGPDGKLYASVGDDNNGCNAQDLSTANGKILRFDVSGLPPGPGGPAPVALVAPADNPFANHPDSMARLVWAFGVRNPFSFHIDPANGDLFIADVGALDYEELDWCTAGGQNFGWPFWEGPLRRNVQCAVVDTLAGFVAPIYSFQRPTPQSGASIIGGMVYRRPPGATTPFPAAYEGDVFLSDVYLWFFRRLNRSGSTWSLEPAPGQPNATDWGNPLIWSSDYQVGPDGALYYTRMWTTYPNPDGQIRKIVSTNPVSVGTGAPGDRIELSSPWPSPASAETRLAFHLDRPRWLRLAVYDLGGRRVRTLISGELRSAGRHVERWDGRLQDGTGVPPGVYLVRLNTDGESLTRRLVWLR